MPRRSAVEPTRAMTRAETPLRRTRAASAAAPTAMNASLLPAIRHRRFRCGVPASGHASAASPSHAPDLDDRALLVTAAATEQEGDDDDEDARDHQAGLGRALGDLGGLVGDAADLGQLRLDVGTRDRLVPDRRRRGTHPNSFSGPRLARPTTHTTAAPNNSTTNMMRYGTHDQSPVNVSPVSSCRARRP